MKDCEWKLSSAIEPKMRYDKARIACVSSSTQFLRWPGAFDLTARLISSTSVGWTMQVLPWRRKLQIQTVPFIRTIFPELRKNGRKGWQPGKHTKMKSGCSELTVSIVGFSSAPSLCVTSRETSSSGTDRQ